MAEMIKINERTWRIEDGFVRFFLLCGNDKAAMIDSGVNSINAREIAETITELPLIYFGTHGDGDHMSGTGAFEEVHMSKSDYDHCDIAKKFPDTCLSEVRDGDCFNLGGRTLRMIDIPGHTKGSVAILDVENRVLYAGDTIQDGDIFMFGKHRAPELFAKSLKKLMDLSDLFDTIVASHGTPELPIDYIQKVLRSWEQVQNGELQSFEMNLFENTVTVKAYKTEYCGFFCEK